MNTALPLSHSERVAALKSSLEKKGLSAMHGQASVPLGCAAADASLGGGLRLGVLHEVFARNMSDGAATGFAAAIAALCACGKYTLWIRQDFSALEHGEIAATGFSEFGLPPARLLMLRAADATDALRAALEALSCAALGTVVLELPEAPKILDLAATRRLTLAAESHGVTPILLRFTAEADPSSCETRWHIAAAPSRVDDEDWGMPTFDAALTRNRHGSAGRWVMTWCGDGFEEQADPGALAATASDRSPQAKEGLRRSA